MMKLTTSLGSAPASATNCGTPIDSEIRGDAAPA